jgi:hypothetical protein
MNLISILVYHVRLQTTSRPQRLDGKKVNQRVSHCPSLYQSLSLSLCDGEARSCPWLLKLLLPLSLLLLPPMWLARGGSSRFYPRPLVELNL